jgi:hypothetical protein
VLVAFLDSFFGVQLIQQFISRNYIRTDGVVTHSKVIVGTAHAWRGATYNTFDVDIAYSYKIGKASFIGSRYRYFEYERAQNVIAAFPVGSQIKVFFNPKNPSEALLSPGYNLADTGFAITVLLCNAGIIFWWWQTFKPASTRVKPPIYNFLR